MPGIPNACSQLSTRINSSIGLSGEPWVASLRSCGSGLGLGLDIWEPRHTLRGSNSQAPHQLMYLLGHFEVPAEHILAPSPLYAMVASVPPPRPPVRGGRPEGTAGPHIGLHLGVPGD